jgi:hypothetical protein
MDRVHSRSALRVAGLVAGIALMALGVWIAVTGRNDVRSSSSLFSLFLGVECAVWTHRAAARSIHGSVAPMHPSELAGGCLCGQVRYRVTGTPLFLCVCHCESCRRAAGAAFVAWGTVLRGNFAITQGALSFHASSPPVRRGFCGHCGTQITYENERRATAIFCAGRCFRCSPRRISG